ncbi:MAG TPA: SDR family oxidoreductase [Bryobacteraceae bacterium]|nr:SDR family oxidoreductase [Bryobacteraceae bacterium]
MRGKTVVITGGTSGIGEVAAVALAGMGARIVLVARDRKRAEATLARLREKGPEARHAVYYADLSSMAETGRIGREIAAAEPRVDVLINNAGALFPRREETAEGLERTFATNHMSYFLLTHALREPLTAAALAGKGARVINTSSGAHCGARLDFGDLQMRRDYRAFRAYSRSKLCNILFTRELARRWQGTGVTANSLHPGFVNTRFGNQTGMFRFLKLFAISPEKGSKTLIYLASAQEPASVSGAYFYKCRVAPVSKEAQDDGAALRLWEETEKLAGL